jgi:hypothetical protein
VQCGRFAPQHDHLLAKQGVLGNELGLAADEVGQRAHAQALGGRFRDCSHALMQTLYSGAADGTAAAKQVGVHCWLHPHLMAGAGIGAARQDPICTARAPRSQPKECRDSA